MSKYKMSREARRKNREHMRKWRAKESKNRETIKKLQEKASLDLLKKLGIEVE